MADPVDDDKRTRILDAAVAKFSAYGFARTSMADIAAAAGMSRPALYQHYSNKEEIFRSMMERVLTGAADRAIAALDRPGSFSEQLDGFLQRWFGDLSELFSRTEHGADLIEAQAGHAKPVIDATNTRIRRALTDKVRQAHETPPSRDQVGESVDLIMLSPVGLKYDSPAISKYRRRLSALARTVAS